MSHGGRHLEAERCPILMGRKQSWLLTTYESWDDPPSATQQMWISNMDECVFKNIGYIGAHCSNTHCILLTSTIKINQM